MLRRNQIVFKQTVNIEMSETMVTYWQGNK